MKTTTLTLCLLPLFASAQVDSSSTPVLEEKPQHALVLGVDSTGVFARVDNGDSSNTTGPDTLRISTKRKNILIITTPRSDRDSAWHSADKDRTWNRDRRRHFTYWSGLDLGINTFVTESGRVGDGPDSGPVQLNNPGSRFVALNIMENKLEFGSHHAGIYTGLGLECTNYAINGNSHLMANGDSTWSEALPNAAMRKNKLRQLGVRVPLMLEFNTKSMRSTTDAQGHVRRPHISRKGNVHLAAGLVGSFYFETMYKVRYTQDGRTQSMRSKSHYNVLPYRLAASVRFGVGGLNLFVEYALTPMFEEGTASKVAPLNVGLTLIGFN